MESSNLPNSIQFTFQNTVLPNLDFYGRSSVEFFFFAVHTDKVTRHTICSSTPNPLLAAEKTPRATPGCSDFSAAQVVI